MGLFSFLHKNKQDAAPGKSEYRSKSDEPFTNARTRTKRSNGGSGKDAESDPILPEKKRARRRLIGAVVLVLAVVNRRDLTRISRRGRRSSAREVQGPGRRARPAR